MKYRALSMLVAVFLLLSACAPATPAAPTEVGGIRRGGTLVVAFPGTPGQLDPSLSENNEDINISGHIFDNLVRLDHNLSTQPQLAESWEVGSDGLTWTFRLRQGVLFHHGTEFTADDVVHTFERILDPDFGSPIRSVVVFIESVEKVDDYTVNFHLDSANADLPSIIGGTFFRVVPHDLTDAQLSDDPKGTGPFKLAEYLPGDHVTLVRNQDYWQITEDGEPLPYLDELRFVYMPEEATRIAALAGGQIDLISTLSFNGIPALKGNSDVVVVQVPSGHYNPIVMNVNEEPFTDLRVRQALKLLVDREGMRQIVTQGLGDLGNDQPISPTDPFWATNLPIPQRDVKKAKELLAAAGYSEGLELTLYTSTVRPGMAELAIAFQEFAAEAGVNVNVVVIHPSVYWADYWMKVPFFVSNWPFGSSAGEILASVYHSKASRNEHAFQSPELDELIELAQVETDQTKRHELYAEAQRLISEEGGVIIAFYQPVVRALRQEVRGFQPHPQTSLDFRNTWLAPTD